MSTAAPVNIRQLDPERDLQAAMDLDQLVWVSDRKLSNEQLSRYAPWRWLLGAETEVDGATQLVGMWGSYALRTTIPGPLGTTTVVPVEGATWAGVHPDHRRTGVARALITEHLRRVRESEVPFTMHEASEPGIYGNFGYGLATYDYSYGLSAGVTLRAPQAVAAAADGIATRTMLAAGSGIVQRLAPLMERCAAARLGGTTRTREHLSRILEDVPAWRDKSHPAEVMIATRDAQDVGFAIFQRLSKWEDGHPHGEITVSEIGGADDAALLALVRRLTSYDLMSSTRFRQRELDDQIMQWIAYGPRAVSKVHVADGMWLRLAEVGRALEARGYESAVNVVIDVSDAMAPWNHGRWRLSVGDDGVGRCARTDDSADVCLGIEHLSAAYLGSRSLLQLAQGGFITESTPGMLRLLSRAMQASIRPSGGIGF